MKRVYAFILVILFTLIALHLSAGEIRLDSETAVSLALKKNLGLQAEKIDLETKERAKQTSWNEFLPSVSVGAALNHSREDKKAVTSMSDSSPWDMSGSIKASLPLSAANRYSIQNRKLAYEEGEISLEDVEKQLEREVKKEFYNLIVLRDKIILIEQNIETAQKRYDQAKTNYENGLVPELTMLSAQVTLENLKPDLEEVKVTYETAQMQFIQMLGLDRDIDIALVGSIEPEIISLCAASLIQKHLSSRLDLQGLMKNLEVLENQKKLTKAEEYTPLLSFTYSYSTGVHDPFHADWGSAESWSGNSTFGISLSLPLDGLIPGSSSKVKIKEIDDSIGKARIELTQARQLAEIEIESIVLRLDKSLRTLYALEQNVALAQKTYNLTEKEYNAGVVELLEVEEAYDELQEAKLGVLEEKYNYLMGIFDLEYALNTKLDI
jgi:outer membrane protein TolC